MPYLGTQPNNVKQNTGLYTPSEILELTKDGSWGGSLELIAESNPSGVNNVDFTDIKQNIYDVHYVTIKISLNGTGSVNMRFYESGVLETASVYQYAYQNGNSAGTFSETKATSANRLFATRTGASGDERSSYNYLYNLGNSSKYSFQSLQAISSQTGTAEADMRFGGGVLPQASTVDGIRFTETSGQLLTGSIKLYGVKQ
jgi:hypothetical protein